MRKKNKAKCCRQAGGVLTSRRGAAAGFPDALIPKTSFKTNTILAPPTTPRRRNGFRTRRQGNFGLRVRHSARNSTDTCKASRRQMHLRWVRTSIQWPCIHAKYRRVLSKGRTHSDRAGLEEAAMEATKAAVYLVESTMLFRWIEPQWENGTIAGSF